jgi:hypothetical protein
MTDEITFDDCCSIILEDWRWRKGGVAPGLRQYKQDLLALLTNEFGIDWHDEKTGSTDHDGSPAILSTIPEDYARLVSPFDRWIEYSVVPGEQEVFDRHTDGLNADLTTLKHHWVVLFRDLLLLQWPKAAFCKTSWTRLRALGLGDPVDEIDFF